MLELYFKYPRVLRRLRDGALGKEMDRIAAHFSDLGYKPASAKIYISRLGRFSEFACRHAGTATIDQDVIDRFMLSLRQKSAHRRANGDRACPQGRARTVFNSVSPDAPDPNGPLLAAYLDHLRRVRGLEPKTCEGLLIGRTPDPHMARMTMCLTSLLLR